MKTSKQSVNVPVDSITEIQRLYLAKNKSTYGAVQTTLERGVKLAIAELRIDAGEIPEKVTEDTLLQLQSLAGPNETPEQRKAREFSEWCELKYLNRELEPRMLALLDIIIAEWREEPANALIRADNAKLAAERKKRA
jgi:hypothetical protein